MMLNSSVHLKYFKIMYLWQINEYLHEILYQVINDKNICETNALSLPRVGETSS